MGVSMALTRYSRCFRRYAGVLLFAVCCLVILLCLPTFDESSETIWRDLRALHQEPEVDSQLASQSTKRILAWTKIFQKDFLVYDNKKAVPSAAAFSKCPEYKDCEWTLDRSKINSSDAVVFHVYPRDFVLSDLPKYRNPKQWWVYMNLEPPIRFMEGMMENVDWMFNLTATYEDDADIKMPYGYYVKRDRIRKDYIPPHSSRNKSIVWLASRCSTLSRREVYVQDLKKFIDIDIFGDCGKPAPKKGSPPINIDFRTELAKKYYFYLAFENSDCEDYITEKFWSSLMAGLVPIVRGQLPRYEKHAPPGSYIHADTFFSYEDLAQYLRHLVDNPAEYNKYFEWRKYYDVYAIGAFMNLPIHCELCRLLHTRPDLQQSYKMSEHHSRKNKCFNYHDNLPMIDFEKRKAYNDELKDFLPIKNGS